MLAFLRMHGHEFIFVTNPSQLAEARALGDTMSGFPLEGSIADQEDYILIHFTLYKIMELQSCSSDNIDLLDCHGLALYNIQK